MKKLTALLLGTAMVLSLAACGITASTSESTASSDAASSEAASTEASAETASAELTTVTPGKLTMSTNAAFPPYEMVKDDGTFEGIDVEVAAAIAEKLGLECVVSPKSIVADVVLQYARALDKSSGDSQIETLYSVMGGLAEAHEFAVLPDFKFTDIPLNDLLRNSDILVAGIVGAIKWFKYMF